MAVLAVADSNLLSPSYARRFLAGLACEFEFALGIVPALEEEFPRVLRDELARREEQRLRRLGADDALLERVEDRVRLAADAWMSSAVDVQHSPFVRSCASRAERQRAFRFRYGPLSGAFADVHAIARAVDEEIVSQSLAAGAERILTNNMATISHPEVNDFARSLGYNSDVLQPPGIAFAQMLDPRRDASRIALAALAMSVADVRRESRTEWQSLARFLHFARIALGHPAAVAQSHLQSLNTDEFDVLLHDAREKALEPSFHAVRQAEAQMHRIVREGPEQTGLAKS